MARQLGAAPEADEPSAALNAAHGLEAESVSTPALFAPDAEVEAIAADAAAPLDTPEPADYEPTFTASTSELDVARAGGDEGENLVLETNATSAEHLVAHESGAWPVVVDNVDDAVLSLRGDAADAQADHLALEREEWLPETSAHQSPVDIESFWAAEPLRSATDEPPHVDAATHLELPPEAVRETVELAHPDAPAFATPSFEDAAAAEPMVDDVPAAPGELTAGDELTAALAWPNEPVSYKVEESIDDQTVAPEQALADAAPELRDSAAPWADESEGMAGGSVAGEWALAPETSQAGTSEWAYDPPSGEQPGADVQESTETFVAEAGPDAETDLAVAEALDRVARRIRDGELPLPTDAGAATDEGALALVLAALLRGGPRG